MTGARVEFYNDNDGDGWRWRVKAANGEILSQSSESYKDKRDAEHGFDLTAEAQVKEQDTPSDG